jgi:putative hydrolase of the HAD superfamily
MPIPPYSTGRQTIQAVLFDLDNTLYDRDLAFERWARSFIEAHFAREDQGQRTDVLAQMVTLDEKGYRPKTAMFADLKTLYPTLPYDVDALCTLFYEQWTQYMDLDAGAVRLLDALDIAGIPFGVITNGSVQQNLKIDQLGLRKRTDCLFISEVFGSRKPEATIFHAAASALNVPCEAILFVGDSPHLDVCGAHAVGMTTAWLHRGTRWPERITDVQPDYRIDSLADLLTILPTTQGHSTD